MLEEMSCTMFALISDKISYLIPNNFDIFVTKQFRHICHKLLSACFVIITITGQTATLALLLFPSLPTTLNAAACRHLLFPQTALVYATPWPHNMRSRLLKSLTHHVKLDLPHASSNAAHNHVTNAMLIIHAIAAYNTESEL